MKLHWDSDHHPTAGTGPGPTGRTQRVLTCPGHRNEPRWRPGERFQDLFEARCDEMAARGRRAVPAVETAATSLGHVELDAAANRLARFLVTRGARPGDRVALLLNDAVPSYVAMLAVLKVHAAYVPLDQGFPRDRLAFIVQDCGARLVLSLSGLSPHWEGLPVPVLCLDQVGAEVAALHGGRLTDSERGAPVDELAYVIYTSGTTGRPKGVAVEHASICNFVRVAAEVYGIRAGDRVYQGMTIAFDFSVEEIWVPLLCGATLVPEARGAAPARRRAGATSCADGGSPPCAASPRCWPPSRRTCRTCASCWCPARPARRTWSGAGTGPGAGSSTSTAPPRPR